MDSERVILQELGKRICKLERQNRRLRQTQTAALIVLTLAVIMGSASSRKTVEANEFILRDENAIVRARLSMNQSLSNPEMVLFDEKGRTEIKLEGGKGSLSGGVVSVFDSQGNLSALISGQRFGGHISLLDATSRPRTTISPGDLWVAGGIRLEDDDGFAWLGRTGLLYEGETQTASAASLILVDNPHRKVLWKAP
jgi:hypothetical protein